MKMYFENNMGVGQAMCAPETQYSRGGNSWGDPVTNAGKPCGADSVGVPIQAETLWKSN